MTGQRRYGTWRPSASELLGLIGFLSASGVHLRTQRSGGEVSVEIDGCDGTPGHALGWAETRGLRQGHLDEWLNEVACPCDCLLVEFAMDQAETKAEMGQA